MAQIKYRVHEVGTDFGVKYAYILELLEKYFGKSKNNRMTALTDEELNLIFEHFLEYIDKVFIFGKQAGGIFTGENTAGQHLDGIHNEAYLRLFFLRPVNNCAVKRAGYIGQDDNTLFFLRLLL